MPTLESDIVANATRALEVAHFPLLPENQPWNEVVITSKQRYGYEGYLPTDLFRPTVYEIDPAHPQVAADDCKRTWIFPRTLGVLESNLGPYGGRFATKIVDELVLLSGRRHGATRAVTAARILVGHGEPHEMHFGVWDNGEPYPTIDALEAGFTRDISGSLTSEGRLKLDASIPANGVYPVIVAKTAVGMFGGALSVLSGVNRIDITHRDGAYSVASSTTEGIVGNLVVTCLPHVKGR